MQNHYHAFTKSTFVFLLITNLFSIKSYAQTDLTTDYFKISINNKGFITSMKNITIKPEQEFNRADKLSPVLCLYNSRKKIYYEPQNAVYSDDNNVLTLKYANGSIAKIKIEIKKK